MSTDARRRMLYEAWNRTWGADVADAMMEDWAPVPWNELARQGQIDARFALVDAQFVALRGEMAELRAELKGEMAELRSEVHSLLPKFIAANLATMLGVAGLVFSIARAV